MKSSARNQLSGTITRIDTEDGDCLVTLTTAQGTLLYARISRFSCRRLNLAVGCPVAVMVKASAVMLATELAPMRLSAENCVAGTVLRVEQGAVNHVLTLDIGGGEQLCAGITLSGSEELALQPGSAAVAVFNANQVVLGVLA